MEGMRCLCSDVANTDKPTSADRLASILHSKRSSLVQLVERGTSVREYDNFGLRCRQYQ